jgi:hypothetical protein
MERDKEGNGGFIRKVKHGFIRKVKRFCKKKKKKKSETVRFSKTQNGVF